MQFGVPSTQAPTLTSVVEASGYPRTSVSVPNVPLHRGAAFVPEKPLIFTFVTVLFVSRWVWGVMCIPAPVSAHASVFGMVVELAESTSVSCASVFVEFGRKEFPSPRAPKAKLPR